MPVSLRHGNASPPPPTAMKRSAISTLALTLALALTGTAHAGPSPVLVVGDSLAVGTEPYLGAMLASTQMTWAAMNGRTTPQGLRTLRADLQTVAPQAVVISLGTNDGPDPQRFADRIRRVLADIPPGTCVVWATINRPPRKGPYTGLNRVLVRAAARDPRVVLVDWNLAVAVGKVRLPDGLHPDAAGYYYRSRMIADALTRRCPAALGV